MYEPTFSPYPIIETERLILRKPTLRDSEGLFELCRRVETSKFSPWNPHKSLSETREMIKFKLSNVRKGIIPPFFAVEEKESGRIVGTASFVSTDESYKIIEIGYSVLSDCWGMGYGTEAAWGLTGYAFDRMEAQRVFAKVLPDNTASIAVLEKLGFTFESTVKKGFYFDETVSDVLIYAITDEEFYEEFAECEDENYGIKENSEL